MTSKLVLFVAAAVGMVCTATAVQFDSTGRLACTLSWTPPGQTSSEGWAWTWANKDLNVMTNLLPGGVYFSPGAISHHSVTWTFKDAYQNPTQEVAFKVHHDATGITGVKLVKGVKHGASQTNLYDVFCNGEAVPKF
ncbi:uncharacterized protein L969DRAFT_22142 [Mixia osmundae IAM 14324]|uniref:Uncharacterized protein n=1 Tax=Mixia osmundae (strain CBS 9802 / IAM 14324 / JCM 22182 / KY 12970) TaxID=764103 RepID=G7DYD2_MIXOS|nr:uncharacterized protein L969DRAFT_22142 [Mixia osmundae IAM 14324]KEI41495.1 hypothetical protein L969DRAFT_22142 [Mixia osmundae IAM 14324]GAA95592.1 hypothetical protein E5Q_02248 [Mixia osmundae IAM 14324]